MKLSKLLLILFLFIGISAFAQVKPVLPQVRVNGCDTEYVFNRSQAVEMAIRLEQGDMCDTIRAELLKQIQDYILVGSLKDSILVIKDKQIAEYIAMDIRSQKVIANKDKEIDIHKKEIRRLKIITYVAYTVTGVVTVLLIIK
jgi:hypothetical protein